MDSNRLCTQAMRSFDVKKCAVHVQERPFGGKLDGLISPDFTTRT
jgi:hypothetical protein